MSSLRRPRRLLAVLLFSVLTATTAWLLYSAYSIYRNLGEFRDELANARIAALDGDLPRAQGAADDARTAAGQAHDVTARVPWNAVASIPFVGQPFHQTADIAQIAHDVAADAVPSAVVGLDQLYRAKTPADRQFDIAAIRAAKEPLDQAHDAVSRAQTALFSVDRPSLPFFSGLHDRLADQLSDAATALDNSRTLVAQLPAMLGADGRRSYLLVIESSTQSRGTGGIAAAVGVLHTDNGLIEIDRSVPDVDLDRVYPPQDFGADFNALYGKYGPPQHWTAANLSPHFPYAGQIWADLWRQQTEQGVNGVIAIDTATLGYLVGAVDTVTTSDGQVLTRENFVSAADIAAVHQFAADPPARARWLRDTAYQIIESALSGQTPAARLVDALGQAVSERRIGVWSTDPAQQYALEHSPLGLAVPNAPGPYVAVAVNNLDGTKLDYYLETEVTYRGEKCSATGRDTEVVVTLTRHLPSADVPDELLGEKPEVQGAPEGTSKLVLTVYTTPGAIVRGMRLNDASISPGIGRELNHPAYSIALHLIPGTPAIVRLGLAEPAVGGDIAVSASATARTPLISTDVPNC